MSPGFRTCLATTALGLFTITACVDPSDVDDVAAGLESQPGTYLVANGFAGSARFYIDVTVQAQAQTKSKLLECQLAIGADSASAACPSLPSLPVHLVADDGEPAGRLIEVGFAPLAAALANRGLTVIAIDPGDEDPGYHPAEAVWDWWLGIWNCQASQADIDTCNNSICAEHGGGDVTVDEQNPSNNPFAEPSCEVTCTCSDGLEEDWIDPPQVQGV